MILRTKLNTIATVLSLLRALTVAFAGPAAASDDAMSMQSRVDSIIAEHGGVQTG